MSSGRRRRGGGWPEVEIFWTSATTSSYDSADGGSAPATLLEMPSDKKKQVEEEACRLDILSALPDEMAIYLLGGGSRRSADQGSTSDGLLMWSAWELRHVVGQVCRNWRRLALDASLMAATLHRFHRTRAGPWVSPGGEVIHVQIGNCGNRVGKEYWRALVREHSLDPSTFAIEGSSPFTEQIYGLPISFNESPNGRFTARSILVDTDPESLNHIRSSPLAGLFQPECMISGRGSCNMNWEEGYFFGGKSVIDATDEAIRRQLEQCDRSQAFVFFHSLGGGCSSGVSTGVISELVKEHLFHQPIVSFAFMPSSVTSDSIGNVKQTISETCNALLGMNTMIDYTDLVFLIDNNMLTKSVPLFPVLSKTAAHEAMNVTAAAAISSVTCSQRFSVRGAECLNTWRKLQHAGVPYPRAHFFSLSHAPFTSSGQISSNASELVREVFSHKACFTGLPSPEPKKEMYRVCMSYFNFVCMRGRSVPWRESARAMEDLIARRKMIANFSYAQYECGDVIRAPQNVIQDPNDPRYVDDFIPALEWLPDCHIRYACCPIAYPLPRSTKSPSDSAYVETSTATLVSSNTKTYCNYLERLLQRYRKFQADDYYKTDPLLLHEAESNLHDLITEFILYASS